MVIDEHTCSRIGFRNQEWEVPTGQNSWCVFLTNRRYFPDKIAERASEQVALPSSNVREIRNISPSFSSYSFSVYSVSSMGSGVIEWCVEGQESGVGGEVQRGWG